MQTVKIEHDVEPAGDAEKASAKLGDCITGTGKASSLWLQGKGHQRQPEMQLQQPLPQPPNDRYSYTE